MTVPLLNLCTQTAEVYIYDLIFKKRNILRPWNRHVTEYQVKHLLLYGTLRQKLQILLSKFPKNYLAKLAKKKDTVFVTIAANTKYVIGKLLKSGSHYYNILLETRTRSRWKIKILVLTMYVPKYKYLSS